MSEVINTYDQLVRAGGGVAILPSYTGTRTQYFYGWAIWRIGPNGKTIVTDPKAHWQEKGKKVFSAGLDKMAALETAKTWIKEQGWYDGKWARNRMRDYVPKDVNKRFPLRKDSK